MGKRFLAWANLHAQSSLPERNLAPVREVQPASIVMALGKNPNTQQKPNLVRCGAVYADLFVPPFEPWSASAAAGTRVSESGRLLVDNHDETADHQAASPGNGKAVGQEEQHGDSSNMIGEMWGGAPKYSSTAERRRCHLDLTQNGMTRRMPVSVLGVAG